MSISLSIFIKEHQPLLFYASRKFWHQSKKDNEEIFQDLRDYSSYRRSNSILFPVLGDLRGRRYGGKGFASERERNGF